MTFEICPSSRPQKIELGATGGASKQESSNMEDMTVEQMTMRANQVTDEVRRHADTHKNALSLIVLVRLGLKESAPKILQYQISKLCKL